MNWNRIIQGGASIEITANTAKLHRNLNTALGSIRAWGQRVSAVGNRLTRPFAGMRSVLTGIITAVSSLSAAGAALAGSQWTKWADSIGKASQRLSADVSVLAKWASALEFASIELSTFEAAITHFRRALGSGSAELGEALAKLGFTADDFAGMNAVEIMELLLRQVRKIKDETQRESLLDALFGRRGHELIGILDQLDDLLIQADRSGARLTAQQAQAAARIADAWTSLQGSIKEITGLVLTMLAPAMDNFARAMRNNATHLSALAEMMRGGVLASAIEAASAAIRLFSEGHVSEAFMLIADIFETLRQQLLSLVAYLADVLYLAITRALEHFKQRQVSSFFSSVLGETGGLVAQGVVTGLFPGADPQAVEGPFAEDARRAGEASARSLQTVKQKLEELNQRWQRFDDIAAQRERARQQEVEAKLPDIPDTGPGWFEWFELQMQFMLLEFTRQSELARIGLRTSAVGGWSEAALVLRDPTVNIAKAQLEELRQVNEHLEQVERNLWAAIPEFL